MRHELNLFAPETDLQTTSTVYVGSMEYPFGGMTMSHMASPDLEALHKMADAIGVSRRHFQNTGQDEKFPHYDICKSKKKLALQHGAIEINDRELIRRCYSRFNIQNYEF